MTAQEFALIRQLLRGDCSQEVSLPQWEKYTFWEVTNYLDHCTVAEVIH